MTTNNSHGSQSYNLPFESFIRSLQSQLNVGANAITAISNDIKMLKQHRLLVLNAEGKSDLWMMISDDIDTNKRAIKKLATYQRDNKSMLHHFRSKQREIIDMQKALSSLIETQHKIKVEE